MIFYVLSKFKIICLTFHLLANIMENVYKTLSTIWTKIKSFPLWLRAVVLILIAALAFFMTVSCGVTRAVVHNGATGTTTEIKISASNPTTVTASPNVEFEPNVRE